MVNLRLTDWEVVEPCTFKQPRADPRFIKKKKEFGDIFLGHHHRRCRRRRRDHEGPNVGFVDTIVMMMRTTV